MALADDSTRPTESLFAKARAGDQAAWRQLFETCYPKVVRVIKRKMNSGAMRALYDPTDFASDVWKSLAAKSDRFDFPTVDHLMAFLVKAAEQKLSDERKRLHTLKRDVDKNLPIAASGPGGGPLDLPSTDPTPSQVFVEQETRERIIEPLSPQGRQIIEWRIQGLSNEQIAERSGQHVRNVQRFLKDRYESLKPRGGAA